MNIKRADLIELLVEARAHLSDEKALKFKDMYPYWKVGVDVKVGQRYQYEGVLYKVLLDHTTADHWKPTESPSLFAKVLIPDETQIYPWEQPESTNPYMKGDKVTHNGKTWESLVDYNIWQPGEVGTETLWVEIV